MRKIFLTITFITLISDWVSGQTYSATITLDQCVDSALIYNPTIKRSRNEANISALAVKIAGSDRYPVISANFSGGYSNEYEVNNDYKTANGTVSANQLLWQKGKINALINQARYDQNAADFSLEAQRQDIIVSVKSFYLTCLMEYQLYQTTLENVSKASLFLDYAKERHQVGAAKKSDVLKAESDLSEAEYERDTYLNSYLRARNELSMLTGISSDRFTRLEDPWQPNLQEFFNKEIDTLYALAFSNYPELQSVMNQQLSQQAKVCEAKAELYPRIGIDAGYSWDYSPVLSQQKGWYTLLTLRWTIFSGKGQYNRIEKEKTQEMIYENREIEVKTFLIKEIRNRLINIREAEGQIGLTNQLMKTTSENLEIAEAQYKAGTGSMLELTDARVNDFLAKQKNIQAITAYQMDLIHMDRLTGISNENRK